MIARRGGRKGRLFGRFAGHPGGRPGRSRPRPRAGTRGRRRLGGLGGAVALVAVVAVALASCGDITTVRDRDLEILWPTRGAVMFDEEVLRVRLRGYHPDEYEVYWYVDGSRERRMWNVWNDPTPHKAYVVDTWFWDWNGFGPYTVGFIAEDRRGREIAHRTVRVYVE